MRGRWPRNYLRYFSPPFNIAAIFIRRLDDEYSQFKLYQYLQRLEMACGELSAPQQQDYRGSYISIQAEC